MSHHREWHSYRDQLAEVEAEASRSLGTADQETLRPWWRGNVLGEYAPRLSVGRQFVLTERAPGREVIGIYRVVAMGIAPEGYVAVAAYGDSVAVASQLPTIDLSMLLLDS